MSAPSDYETETRALALAAFTLTKALMAELEKQGVLSGAGGDAVLDQTLWALEHRHQDRATDVARRIIEATAMARAGRLPGTE